MSRLDTKRNLKIPECFFFFYFLFDLILFAFVVLLLPYLPTLKPMIIKSKPFFGFCYVYTFFFIYLFVLYI